MARPAVLAALALLFVIVAVAVVLAIPSSRAWVRGRRAPRTLRPSVATAAAGSATAPETFAEMSDAESLDGAGEKNDDAAARSKKPGVRKRRAPEVDQWLAVIDEFERRVDAAMARARESVVALEYTPGRGPSGRRRIASGVVINAWGEVLSIRIDRPRDEPASDSKEERPASAPIVARDYLGRRHAARWVACDPHTGLTLLRVAPRVVRPIRRAVDGPKLGSQVFVLGNPFGLGDTVHRGHVAGLERILDLGERQQLGGLIQVHVPLYPGDSGAAVVDGRGGWLGLIRGGLAVRKTGRSSSGVSSKTTSFPSAPALETVAPATPADQPADAGARTMENADDPDAEPEPEPEPESAFGFAIPTRDALWVADQLRTYGRVDRAYLGVRLDSSPVSDGPADIPAPTTPQSVGASSSASASASASASTLPSGSWRGAGTFSAASGGAPTTDGPDLEPVPGEGARVLEVIPETPASHAGLRAGDRIVGVDDQTIRSRNDLIDRLDRIPAHADIVVTVLRADKGGGSGPVRLDLPLQTASRSGHPEPPRPLASPRRGTGRHRRTATPGTSTAAQKATKAADHRKQASASPRPEISTTPIASPDHPAPAPASTANTTDAEGSLNELKLTLPRAVVERIEHLERRIDELEHNHAHPAASETPDRHPEPNERTAQSSTP